MILLKQRSSSVVQLSSLPAVTAFLKFTQLIVGWVTPGWDFRGIYNAIAADNALDYDRIVAVA